MEFRRVLFRSLYNSTVLTYDKMGTFFVGVVLEIGSGILGGSVTSSCLMHNNSGAWLRSDKDIFLWYKHCFGDNSLGWIDDTHASILLSLSCKFCCILTISSIFFSNLKK